MDRRNAREERAARLKQARIAAKFPSAPAAARAFGWPVETYKAHENGRNGFDNDAGRKYAKAFGVSLSKLMTGDEEEDSLPDSRPIIPVMGYVGAGGDIEPEYEQVPYDGLEQIELPEPIGLIHDPIAFLVRGESMTPRYYDGEIVIVEREQSVATESLIGAEAVVRTYDGHRYLKRIKQGTKRHTFDLVSPGAAPTIVGVRIAWASQVKIRYSPAAGLRRIQQKPQVRHRAAGKERRR